MMFSETLAAVVRFIVALLHLIPFHAVGDSEKHAGSRMGYFKYQFSFDTYAASSHVLDLNPSPTWTPVLLADKLQVEEQSFQAERGSRTPLSA